MPQGIYRKPLPMSQPTPSRGAEAILEILRTVLAEQYSLERQLGRGAYSLVFEVTNRQLGRKEALKVFIRVLEEAAAVRFVKETKLAASLDHPNIVKVFNYGEARGIPWYTMQLVDGTSLAEFVRQNGCLDVELFLRLAHPILDALAYSHAAGIIHRDIKPQNLLLDKHLRPYITDFGLAKVLEEPGLTSTGSVLGTPGFLAPEVLAGQRPSFASDVYALGVTFYQMLAGRLPFEGGEAFEIMLGSLHKDPPPLSQFRPDLPDWVVRAVMKAIARRPEERFPTVDTLKAALTPWEDDSAVAPSLGLAEAQSLPSFLPGVQTGRTLKLPRPTAKRWVYAVGTASLLALAVLLLALRALTQSAPEPASLAGPGLKAELPRSTLPKTTGPQMEPTGVPTPKPSPSPPVSMTPTPTRSPVPTSPPPAQTLASPARPLRELVIPLTASVPDQCVGVSVPLLLSINAEGHVLTMRGLAPVAFECLTLAQEFLKNLSWAPARNAQGNPVATTLATEVHFARGNEEPTRKEDTP